MYEATDVEILRAITAARPVTPADIREHFGADIDAAEAMKFLTILG